MSRAIAVPHGRARADTLVLSGGGVKGVATLGALDRLRAAGFLSGVRTVVGTSAGALVGALVATRRDMKTCLDVLCNTAYTPDFDFERLASEFGLDDGTVIERLLCALLDPQDRDLTFADLKRKYGVELIVCVTNVSLRRAEYLGPETHPSMKVSFAVRMSCSVPLYFGAVSYNGHWYVDGSIVDNFACDWAADRGAAWILGVSTRPVDSPIATFESFVAAVVESAASSQLCPRADILNLELRGVASLNFGAGKSVFVSLFESGAQQADVFIKKKE